MREVGGGDGGNAVSGVEAGRCGEAVVLSNTLLHAVCWR